MNINSITNKVLSAISVLVLYTAFTTSTLANERDEVILYLNDPLGTAIAAYDENGDVCWEETHTPYGDKMDMEDSFNRQGCGVVAEERGFTGHSEDFDTDLVYMQQRYYDPTIGRFLSTDPVGPIAGDSRSINRYSYAANSPYRYVDPDGRFFISGTIAAITVASIAYSAYTGYRDGGALGAAAEVSPYNATKESYEAYTNGDYLGAAAGVGGFLCKVCKAADNVIPRKLYHYTNKSGAEAIEETGLLKTDSKGRVFLTEEKIPPSEANNALFMGRGGAKGSHRVEVELKNGSALSRGSQPNELIHQGTIRDPRQGILTVKENDF